MAIEKLSPFGIRFGSDKNTLTKAELDKYLNIATDKLNEIKTAFANMPTKRIIPKTTKTNCFLKIGRDGLALLVEKLPPALGGKLESDKIAKGSISKYKFKQSIKINKKHLNSDFKLENRHFYKGDKNNKPVILVYGDTLKDGLPMSKFNPGCFTERTLKNVKLTSDKIASKSIYSQHFAKDFVLPKQKTGEHVLNSYFTILNIFNNDVKCKITVPENLLQIIDDELKDIKLRIVLDYVLNIANAEQNAEQYEHENENHENENEGEEQDDYIQYPAHMNNAYQVWGNLACISTEHSGEQIKKTYDLKEALGVSLRAPTFKTIENIQNNQVYIHAEFVLLMKPHNDLQAIEEAQLKQVVEFSIKGIPERLQLESYLTKIADATVRLKCTLTKNSSNPREKTSEENVCQPTEKYNITENINQSKPDENSYSAEYEYKKASIQGYGTNKQFGNMTMLLEKQPSQNRTRLSMEKNEGLYDGFKDIQKSNTTEITVNAQNNRTNGIRQTTKTINDGLNLEEINTSEEKEEINEGNNISRTKVKTIVWKNKDLITNEIKQYQAEINEEENENENSIVSSKEININLGDNNNINYTEQTTYQKDEANKITNGTRTTRGQFTDGEFSSPIKVDEIITNRQDGTYEYNQEKELIDKEGNKHKIKIEEKKELILKEESGEAVEFLKQQDSFAWNKKNIISKTITHEVFNAEGDKIGGTTKSIDTQTEATLLDKQKPSIEIQKEAELLISDDAERRNKERLEAIVIDEARNEINIINDTINNTKSFNTDNLSIQSHGDLLGYGDIRTDLQNKVNQYQLEEGDNIQLLPEDPLQNIDVSLDNLREHTQSVLVGERYDIFEQYLMRRTESETFDKITNYELIEPQDWEGEQEPRIRPIFTPVLTGINFKEVALEHSLAQVTKEKEDLEYQNKKLTIQVHNYHFDNQDKAKQIQNLQNNAKKLQDNILKLQLASNKKNEQIKELNDEIDEKNALIQNNQELSEQEKTGLQNQVNSLNKDKEQLIKEKEMLTNQNRQVVLERAKTLRELNSALYYVKKYQTERDNLSKQIVSKDKEITTVNRKLTRAKNEIAVLENDIKQQTNTINTLLNKITIEQNKRAEIEQRVFDTEEEKNRELKKQQRRIEGLENIKSTLEEERENNRKKIQKQTNEINSLNTYINEQKSETDNVIKENEELRQKNKDIINENQKIIKERDEEIVKLNEDISYRDGVIKSQNVYQLLEKKKDRQIRQLEKDIETTEETLEKERDEHQTKENLLKIVELVNNSQEIGDDASLDEAIIYSVLRLIFEDEDRTMTVQEATMWMINNLERLKSYQGNLNLEEYINEIVTTINKNGLVQLLGASTKPLEDKIEESQNKINELEDKLENKNQIIENDRKEKEKFKNKAEKANKELQKANKQVELANKKLSLMEEEIKRKEVETQKLITSMDLKQQELDKGRKLTAEQKKESSKYKAMYKEANDKVHALIEKKYKLEQQIKEEQQKQDRIEDIIMDTENLRDEATIIENKYNELVNDYKTSKIKEDEFNNKRDALLLQISSLKLGKAYNKIPQEIREIIEEGSLTKTDAEEFVYKEQYTQIERLQGLKDKIEVGVTLPVIERQKEATLTFKRDPNVIVQRKEDIIAVKLAARNFSTYKPIYKKELTQLFLTIKPEAFFTGSVYDTFYEYLSYEAFPIIFPKSWEWMVVMYKTTSGEEVKCRDTILLCDDHEQPVTYKQDLSFFTETQHMPSTSNASCFLVGYDHYHRYSLFVDNRFDKVHNPEGLQIPRDNDVFNFIKRGFIPHTTSDIFNLVDWHYRQQNFKIKINGSWRVFKFNINTIISMIKETTDWIPITTRD